jgi:selenide,water dikinase
LNCVGFPLNCLPLEILQSVLQGGLNKVREAGAVLAGGHSIEDEEPKFGLAVFGEVSRERTWRVGGAREGDVALLTKPVGTGILATALKAGMAEDEETAEMIRSMRMLNDIPRHLDERLFGAVHACTDITGFGLAGHALDLLSDGGLDLKLHMEKLPVLPGVLDKCEMGLIPAGGYNNRKQYESSVAGMDSLSPEQGDLLFDPQTSGGLLMAVSPAEAEAILSVCRERGFESAAVVGTFTSGAGNLQVV